MQGKQPANSIFDAHESVLDIEQHMLHFLENHDEQRIASPDFAGNAQWGKPALVVSNLISRAPTLLYFAQDVGEDGSENAGFGAPTRTSIFDYIGVPAHQAWMNNGKFDGANLTAEQAALRDYYKAVMSLNNLPAVVGGEMSPLKTEGSERVVGFTRSLGQQSVYVLSNFSAQPQTVTVNLSKAQLGVVSENTLLNDLLENHTTELKAHTQGATFNLTLDAFSSAVLTNKANNE